MKKLVLRVLQLLGGKVLGESDRESSESELLVNDDGSVYHLGIKPEQLADDFILVGDPGRAERVAKHFDTDSVTAPVVNREYVTITGTYKGMPISVVGTGIGTDNCEIALVEMHGCHHMDLETRTIKESEKKPKPRFGIRVGTCGGYQEEDDVGTLVISTHGIGLESTGQYFFSRERNSTAKKLAKKARKALRKAAPYFFIEVGGENSWKPLGFDLGFRCYLNTERGNLRPYGVKNDEEVAAALQFQAMTTGLTYTSGATLSACGFFGAQGRRVPGTYLTAPEMQMELAKVKADGVKVRNNEMENSLLVRLGRQLGYRIGTICPIVANRVTGKKFGSKAEYLAAEKNAIVCALDSLYTLRKRVNDGSN